MESGQLTVNHLPNDAEAPRVPHCGYTLMSVQGTNSFLPLIKTVGFNLESIFNPKFLSKGVSLRNPHPCFPTGASSKASFCSHLSHGLGLLSSLDNGERQAGFLNCEFFYHWEKLGTKWTIIKLFCKDRKLLISWWYKTTMKQAGIIWNIGGFFCFKNWNESSALSCPQHLDH